MGKLEICKKMPEIQEIGDFLPPVKSQSVVPYSLLRSGFGYTLISFNPHPPTPLPRKKKRVMWLTVTYKTRNHENCCSDMSTLFLTSESQHIVQGN